MNQISANRPLPLQEGFDAAVARMAPVERLMEQKDELRARYLAAKPFPHLVLDNFFDPVVLDRVAAEFPGKGGRDWLSYDTANEIKQTSRGALDLPAFSQAFLWQMCAPPMMAIPPRGHRTCGFVRRPALPWRGHARNPSAAAALNMHADWTQHPVLPLTRRLNLIVYLNRDWDPAWGGALELKNPGDDGLVAKVEPFFNRAVIFPTTAETLHGFPDPMTCPADRSRSRSGVVLLEPGSGRDQGRRAHHLPPRQPANQDAGAAALLHPARGLHGARRPQVAAARRQERGGRLRA